MLRRSICMMTLGLVVASCGAYPSEPDESQPIVVPTTGPAPVAPGAVVPASWQECLAPLPPYADRFLFGDWIRRVDGLIELGPEELAGLLERNPRDDLANLVVSPGDGTLLFVEDPATEGALNSALLPELDGRLGEAAALGASIVVPMTTEPGAGGGLRDVVAFMPTGTQAPLHGCDPGWYAVVTEWRDAEAPGLTDLEAWRAIVRKGSPEWASFDAWWAGKVAELVQPPPSWLELAPSQRQLNPEDTPAEVLAGLGRGLVALEFGGEWESVGGVLCLRLEIAWGECVGTGFKGVSLLDGWFEPGKGFEIWLMSEDRFSAAVAKLAEVSPELASELETRDSEGFEQVLLVRPAISAESIADLVAAAAQGQVVLTVEVTTLDALERSWPEPSESDNPEGP